MISLFGLLGMLIVGATFVSPPLWGADGQTRKQVALTIRVHRRRARTFLARHGDNRSGTSDTSPTAATPPVAPREPGSWSRP
ncbi:hypothetical protein AB0F81_41055 [Actinoplanes sp. NPDC024001]|uniref:hypothetical protein n=1 Tax=Actinoplanes sp. NPDC024001 TaxID=3154598 RepID=UPI0033DD1E08